MGVLQKKKAREKVLALSQRYNLKIDPDAKISNISVGMQQRVEILKMLYRDNEILIFDEPTAVLTPQEIDELMEIMRGFKAEGKSILFITHKLAEIKAVADRCTVLRKGKYMGTVDVASTSVEEMSRLMVGRDVQLKVDKAERAPGEVVLDVQHVSVPSKVHNKDAVRDVSFQVRQGEIVCLGRDRGQRTDRVCLWPHRPGQAVCRYLHPLRPGHLPQLHPGPEQSRHEPHSRGPAQARPGAWTTPWSRTWCFSGIWNPEFHNHGMIKFDAVRQYAEKLIGQYDIRSGQGPVTIARSMSGGNQQKAIVAREIDKAHKLLGGGPAHPGPGRGRH